MGNIETLSAEAANDTFEQSLYKQHFLYPLIALYPLQIDLHWLMIFIKMPEQEREDEIFEELVGEKPNWPLEFENKEKGAELLKLTGYIKAYKEKCQMEERCDKKCPFYDACDTRKKDKKYGWCEVKKYSPMQMGSGKLPKKMQTVPTAYDIMNHQLEWLKELFRETDDLNYLRNTIKDSLMRLLKVRDKGEKYETWEVSAFDTDEPDVPISDSKFSLAEQEVAHFCDHMLEEIEDLCIQIDQPFSMLQDKVDRAQAYVKDGFEKLKLLESNQKRIFAPLLANIHAFLESFDRVLHRFKSDELVEPDEILFMMALPLEKPKNKTWYQLFCTFVETKTTHSEIFKNPEYLFQSPAWSYTALGPRLLGELYISTINQSYKIFDYLKAKNYLRKLKKSFIKPTSIFKKIKLLAMLLISDKKEYFSRFSDLKVKPSNLLYCYRNQLRLPIFIKIFFASGLLAMAEMDYKLWKEYILNFKKSNTAGILIITLLMMVCFMGIISLIDGRRRIGRAFKLFYRLIMSAVLSLLMIFLVFPKLYNYTPLSCLFLIFGSIFIGVIVNTIGSNRKE